MITRSSLYLLIVAIQRKCEEQNALNSVSWKKKKGSCKIPRGPLLLENSQLLFIFWYFIYIFGCQPEAFWLQTLRSYLEPLKIVPTTVKNWSTKNFFLSIRNISSKTSWWDSGCGTFMKTVSTWSATFHRSFIIVRVKLWGTSSRFMFSPKHQTVLNFATQPTTDHQGSPEHKKLVRNEKNIK